MKYRIGLPLILAITAMFLVPEVSRAEEIHACYASGSPTRNGHLAGYRWQIEPLTKQGDGACQATVWTSAGKQKFQVTDHDMSLESVSGQDINGDGEPDIVFVGYSGGAHCCWTYWIVSLGTHPGLIKKIENERGADFKVTGPNKRIEIWTSDGAFDYFDNFRFSHGETVFPEIILAIDGNQVRDVSAEHWPYFERQIAEARRELTPEMVHKWKPTNAGSPDIRSYESIVLRIVLANLYGGRPTEAWRALAEFWPPADASHTKRVILETRKRGILRFVSSPPNPT